MIAANATTTISMITANVATCHLRMYGLDESTVGSCHSRCPASTPNGPAKRQLAGSGLADAHDPEETARRPAAARRALPLGLATNHVRPAICSEAGHPTLSARLMIE